MCYLWNGPRLFIRWLFIAITVVLKKHFGSSHLVLCCWGTSTNQLSSCRPFKKTDFLSKPGSELSWLSHNVILFVRHCTPLCKERKERMNEDSYFSFASSAFIVWHPWIAINTFYYFQNKVQNPFPDIQGNPWFHILILTFWFPFLSHTNSLLETSWNAHFS